MIAPAAYGGAESVVRALAAGDRARGGGDRVAALLQHGDPSLFTAQLATDGVPVEEIRCGRRRYGAEARAVADLLVRHGVGCLHTHVYHADLVGLRAARRAGVPVVATVHGFTGGDLKNRFYQWLDVRALRRFDGVACVAEPIRRRLERAGVDARRLHLVPNGVGPRVLRTRQAARASLGIADEAPLIGWIGRVSAEKGPDLLLDALDRLDGVAASAVVIGDGPLAPALAARRGAGHVAVRWAGALPDAAGLMPAFDVLVISSRTEGLPVVLLEAMAAGVPVAAFAVGGIPDAVDGERAFLAPPADVPALAAALRQALDDRAEAARRAGRAQQEAQRRFGVHAWLERMDAVYAAAAER